MVIKIEDKETQERMLTLWQKMAKYNRLSRIYEARHKIAKGKGEIAQEIFWKEIEKLFPETRDTAGWSYDPIENKIMQES
jgi:hypothetical protein